MNLGFAQPWRLLILLAVAALVVAYLLAQRRRKIYAVRFTQLALLDKVAPRRPNWRRHVPAGAFLAALSLLVLGFARPQADVHVPREQATVMIAVDTSVSMQATDVRPSRLEAAKAAAAKFVEELPATFRVGLVSFSGTATVVVSPTLDHGAVRRGVDDLQLGPSTAIGEAVFTALDAIPVDTGDASESGSTPATPARIVLLSDGTNTTGRSLTAAAAAAERRGIPVSTIAYGTEGGTVLAQGQLVPVPVDAPALEQLAQETGGSFYEAASSGQLRSVYRDIGSSIGFRIERHEVTTWFVGLALLAAFAAAAASLRWFARLP